MVVNFTYSSRIEKVTVEGNGESIYYAIDEKNTVTGMNRVQCGKMNINFKKNKVSKIAFLAKPDGRFIPPKEIKTDDKELVGFRWRIAERPTKESIMKVVSPTILINIKPEKKDSILVKRIEKEVRKIPVNKIKKKLRSKL